MAAIADPQGEAHLVRSVLEHPAGFDLDLLGGLITIRVADGPMTDKKTIEIEWEDENEQTHSESFPRDQIDQAVDFFISKRRELGYGLDFESSGA